MASARGMEYHRTMHISHDHLTLIVVVMLEAVQLVLSGAVSLGIKAVSLLSA